MKNFGLGLGIIVIILIGAILIVPSFLNWNEYKEPIEKTASHYTGRVVKIKGDVSLSLLPTATLSVGDVTVTNMDLGRAEYMLSLKSLDIKVSFFSVISSLLGGKIKVEKFILVDPIVALEMSKDGRANWDFGAAKTTEAPQEKSTSDISLDQFQIVNGQVSFEDMASGQMELFRKINLNVKAKSIEGPFEVDGDAKYQGLDAVVSLGLGKVREGKKIPVTLDLAMLDNQVKISLIGGGIMDGKASSFDGKMSVKANDISNIMSIMDRMDSKHATSSVPPRALINQDFSIDTALDLTMDKIAVKDLDIRVGQSHGQGSTNITIGDKITFLSMLSINKLDLDSVLAKLSEQEAAKSAQTTKDKKAAAIAEAQPDSQAPSQSALLDRISGTLDLKLAALKYNDKIANQISLNLQVKDSVVDITALQARMPGGAALIFKGKLEQAMGKSAKSEKIPTLTGDISLNASNLRGMLSWLKLDVNDIPAGQLVQFSYQSSLKATPSLVQVYDIRGGLDAMNFKGGVSYALGDRPSYGMDIAISGLNIDSYMPTTKQDAIDFQKSLAILDSFDVNYKLGLSNVTVNDIKIRSGRMEGLLLGGKLNAKVIQLDDVAGLNLSASGQGSNFTSKPEMTLKLSANASTLATLQRTLKIDDKFDMSKLGALKLEGSIATTLEKMDLDLKSTIGATKMDVLGTVRSATLKQFPEIGSADIQVDAASASLATLIDQLALSMTKPAAADDRPVQLKGRLTSNPDTVDLSGTVNVAAGKVTLNGKRKGSGAAAIVDLTLDVAGQDTREFIRGLGVGLEPSVKKLGPIALKVKMTGRGDQYDFASIAGDIGPVKFSGNGKLDMAPKKPVFDFTMKAGEIPVHAFLKEDVKNKAGKKTPDQAFGQWTKTPIDLSLLSSFDGQAHISAARLRYNDYIFENPTFDTTLKDGKLVVDNFTGRLFGGGVSMSGFFGGTGTPKMEMNIELKQASLKEATKSSAGIEAIEGFFDMSGKFKSEGASQYDLISALSGGGNIVAGPGVIDGIDVPALSNQLAKVSDANSLVNLLGTTLSGGKTSYKGGQSTITASKGKIQFSPFDIELDGAKSNVKMAADLLHWTLQSNGSLALTAHPSAPPIGVDISGNISDPKIVYNTDPLKKYIGGKVATKILQKAIGGEGGLGNIFGEPAKQAAPSTSNTAPSTSNAVPAAPTTSNTVPKSTPVEKPATMEDFGAQLLQKMFEKKTEPAK